jgi:hypothetical protein
MAIKIRKALQRWKGPTTDMQKIIADKTHPKYAETLSMTKQSLKEETEIYNIIKRARMGVVEHVNQYEARYGDATAMDLQESMNLVKETNKWFGKLPVELRNHFKNDIVSAVEFLDRVKAGDPKAIEQGRKLGLVEKEKPTPDPNVVPEPTPEPPPA